MVVLVTGIVLILTCSFAKSQETVLPSSYVIADHIVSANGSITTSGNITTNGTLFTQPNTTVLFDGEIPTLTGLDGNMWASQLLTLNTTTAASVVSIAFQLQAGHLPIHRAEIVMFNCPEWGIGVHSIEFQSVQVNISATSCESLVRVCIPCTSSKSTATSTQIMFILDPSASWVHLAEVTFYQTNSSCPPNTIITSPPIATPTISNTKDNRNTLLTALSMVLSLLFILVCVVAVLIGLQSCYSIKRNTSMLREGSHAMPHLLTPLDQHVEMGEELYATVDSEAKENIQENQYSILQDKTGPVQGGAGSQEGGAYAAPIGEETPRQKPAVPPPYSATSPSLALPANAGVHQMAIPPLDLQVETEMNKPLHIKNNKTKDTNVESVFDENQLYAQVQEKRSKKKSAPATNSSSAAHRLWTPASKKKKGKAIKRKMKEMCEVDKKQEKTEAEYANSAELCEYSTIYDDVNAVYSVPTMNEEDKKQEKSKVESNSAGAVYSIPTIYEDDNAVYSVPTANEEDKKQEKSKADSNLADDVYTNIPTAYEEDNAVYSVPRMNEQDKKQEKSEAKCGNSANAVYSVPTPYEEDDAVYSVPRMNGEDKKQEGKHANSAGAVYTVPTPYEEDNAVYSVPTMNGEDEKQEKSEAKRGNSANAVYSVPTPNEEDNAVYSIPNALYSESTIYKEDSQQEKSEAQCKNSAGAVYSAPRPPLDAL